MMRRLSKYRSLLVHPVGCIIKIFQDTDTFASKGEVAVSLMHDIYVVGAASICVSLRQTVGVPLKVHITCSQTTACNGMIHIF